MRRRTTFGIIPPFDGLSPTLGQVAHVLRTRLPLFDSRKNLSLDLHVLATPPAFTLSQDQTLRIYINLFVKPNPFDSGQYKYSILRCSKKNFRKAN